MGRDRQGGSYMIPRPAVRYNARFMHDQGETAHVDAADTLFDILDPEDKVNHHLSRIASVYVRTFAND